MSATPAKESSSSGSDMESDSAKPCTGPSIPTSDIELKPRKFGASAESGVTRPKSVKNQRSRTHLIEVPSGKMGPSQEDNAVGTFDVCMYIIK